MTQCAWQKTFALFSMNLFQSNTDIVLYIFHFAVIESHEHVDTQTEQLYISLENVRSSPFAVMQFDGSFIFLVLPNKEEKSK